MPDSFNFASPPFDQLRPHQRETFKQALSVGYYAPGETLLEAGSAVPGLFVLLKGVVEERGDDGRVFAQYAADDLFDVRGLFSGSSKHRYLAIEESIVYELPASCFHQLCGENPGFARFFQADLAAKRQLAQRDGQNLAEFILTRIAREHLLPALEVEASLSLGDAARLQLSHGADALLVRLERDGPELGIVTRTDLMSAHFRDGRSELEAIGPLAHGPLASVELGDFLFDAMILMTRQRIERVAVTEDGQVIGLLHLTQVLSLFSTHSHVLALRIARADDLGDLRRCAENPGHPDRYPGRQRYPPALHHAAGQRAQRAIARTAFRIVAAANPARALLLAGDGQRRTRRAVAEDRPGQCPGPGRRSAAGTGPGDDAALQRGLAGVRLSALSRRGDSQSAGMVQAAGGLAGGAVRD